jgi:hypothetical protein
VLASKSRCRECTGAAHSSALRAGKIRLDESRAAVSLYDYMDGCASLEIGRMESGLGRLGARRGVLREFTNANDVKRPI